MRIRELTRAVSTPHTWLEEDYQDSLRKADLEQALARLPPDVEAPDKVRLPLASTTLISLLQPLLASLFL